MCSAKFLSDCRRPASIRATLIPDSASRLHAQPPEAPEPTTSTSNCSSDALFTSSGTGSDEYRNDEPLLIHHSSYGPTSGSGLLTPVVFSDVALFHLLHQVI